MISNLSDDNERRKIFCKYCAEEIYEEATICRFCGKKQKNIIDKVGEDLEENRGKVDHTKSYWIIIWLPTILLLGLSFFVGTIVPAIIGIAYWCYMYYKYDLR